MMVECHDRKTYHHHIIFISYSRRGAEIIITITLYLYCIRGVAWHHHIIFLSYSRRCAAIIITITLYLYRIRGLAPPFYIILPPHLRRGAAHDRAPQLLSRLEPASQQHSTAAHRHSTCGAARLCQAQLLGVVYHTGTASQSCASRHV